MAKDRDKRVLAVRRRYRSSFNSQRVRDAKLFLTWMMQKWPTYLKTSERLPRTACKLFLQENAKCKLQRDCLHSSRMYLKRCVEFAALVLNTTAVADIVNASTAVAVTHEKRDCDACVMSSRRKRSRGMQGRPSRAQWVREELWEWFCSLKRSVTSRIPVSMVMRQAEVLVERYIRICMDAGVPADSVVVDCGWLRRWRREYRVSLRKPNRRWKVPRAVLLERLRIGWCNVFRIRKFINLVHGYDPVQINFDQTPYHMNEAGSKEVSTLSFRGCGEVPLKEGHAATRKRWTANTLVVSNMTLDAPVPPLEVMFKADGQVLQARLRHHIPDWAPWLTVVTSPKGSYRLEHVLDYLENILDPWRDGRDWRIVWCDTFAPQCCDAVVRLCWSRGYILLIHGGGVTPVVQPPDTDLHGPLRRKYMDMEMSFAVAEQRRNRRSLGTPHEQDCMAWMAMLWSEKTMHVEAAQGFRKTGLSLPLDGSCDFELCREAQRFWHDLQMSSLRRDVIAEVETEWRANRLPWSFDSVQSLIIPFPKHGRHLDNQPDDDGSSADELNEGTDHDDDDDDDNGHEQELDQDPQENTAVAVPASLEDSRAFDQLQHEHAAHENVLQSVHQQLLDAGMDGVAAAIQENLRLHGRRARNMAKNNPALCLALHREKERNSKNKAMEDLRLKKHMQDRAQVDEDKKTIQKDMQQLVDMKIAAKQAAVAAECKSALKSFDLADIGQGHPDGGNAKHRKNRLEILERVRGRAPPLSPALLNDWHWFCRNWDKRNIEIRHPSVRAGWPSEFARQMKDLVRKLSQGESNAFESWLLRERAALCPLPALRV